MTPFEAALKGQREIGFTIISITVSLVAVFIPVLLMGGVIGRIFNEFAVVVTIAIVASAFVSLTLTPMLAARLPAGPRPRRRREEEPVRARLRPGAGGLPRAASTSACASASPMFLIFLASVVATVSLFAAIPKGFFPHEDIGQLSVSTEARQDISFPAMVGPAARGPSRSSRRSPLCRACRQPRRLDRVFRHDERRLVLRRAEAEGPAPALPKVLADLRRQLAQVPGIIGLHHAGAEPAPRRAGRRRASTSSSCRAWTRPSSTAGRCGCRRHGPRRRDLHRRHHRPPEHRPAGDGRRSTATRPARSASRPTSCARRSTPASARGRSRPSTRPPTATR